MSEGFLSVLPVLCPSRVLWPTSADPKPVWPSVVITKKISCEENGQKTGDECRVAGWRRKRNSWWETRRRACIRGNSFCNLSTVTKLWSTKIYFPLTKSGKVEGSMRHFVIRWAFTVRIVRPSSYHQSGGLSPIGYSQLSKFRLICPHTRIAVLTRDSSYYNGFAGEY